MLTDAVTAARWLDRASDELDAITRGRLVHAFPTDTGHAVRVKKAVCAVADALYMIDEQIKAGTAGKDANGTYHGAVASVSSGRESISYATGGGSMFAAAALDSGARSSVVSSVAARYLAGIPDKNGVNLLYAGGACCAADNDDNAV